MLLVKNLVKKFILPNGTVDLYHNFDLKVSRGSFVSIVGNNGTGKTTLLNIIAGIEPVNGGTITVGNTASRDINLGYVFQNYRQALYPWMNVMDNIALPLTIRGIKKNERYDKVRMFCSTHHLSVNLNAYPYSLSGGQQQQVAIIRSWINSPDLILMDEPFSSLDYYTSFKFQKEVSDLWSGIRTTIIFVSHRIEEAIYLSDRIIVLGGCPVKILDDIKNPIPFPRNIRVLRSAKCNVMRNRILARLENL